MGGDDLIGEAGPALWMLSSRADELTRLVSSAGWRVAAGPGGFIDSGAGVALVDARDDFDEGLAATAALALEAERIGAAVLVLASRDDAGQVRALYEAGATHFALSPTDGELLNAVRFAARHAERLGRREGVPNARRRDDSGGEADDAATRWIDRRLAADGPVVAARAALSSFDLVNSAHGRAAGDSILDQAAARLERVAAALFGDESVVSRVEGPDFVVAGDGARVAPGELATRLERALAEPFGPAVVGARVGAAASHPGEDAAALLRRAGEALAPAEGGIVPEELAVELHHAMARGEVAMLFQPQVAMSDGRIVGAEALARWDHPRLGAVGAEALFAAAARAGLSAALSEHVQRLALEAGAAWPAALSGLLLSVNVTAEDVGAADFAERFLGRVAATGFPPKRLTVEVTETGLIADLDAAGALLGQLRAAGCRTAIDDFGTGYSSLAYLNALPLDYLKLDKALVRGVEHDGRERLVVRSVLALARSLGLRTIAEGVETAAQRELLAAEGCESYQGFLCAGAVGAEELVCLVETAS